MVDEDVVTGASNLATAPGSCHNRVVAEVNAAGEHPPNRPEEWLLAIPRAAVHQALSKRMCPWCDTGPWQMIAQHARIQHHLTAREIRDFLGLPNTASFASPQSSAKHRAAAIATRNLVRNPPQRPRRVGPAEARRRAEFAANSLGNVSRWQGEDVLCKRGLHLRAPGNLTRAGTCQECARTSGRESKARQRAAQHETQHPADGSEP